MSERRSAALLALVLAGCDSRALVVGDGAPAGDFGGRSRSAEPRCPDGAAARAADGACWPTRHLGRWRGFVTGDARYRHVSPEPLELPSGEVWLEIHSSGSGLIRFGTDAPACAADAGARGNEADAAAAGDAGALALDAGRNRCAARADAGPPRGLLLEHDYPLDGLSMSGASERERQLDPRVTFSLQIAEPWRELCVTALPALAEGPCSCDAGGCAASSDALLFSLSLSRDAQALRGTLTSSSDSQLVAGLELIRP